MNHFPILRNENTISLLSYGAYAFFEASVIYIMAHTYSKGIFGEWVIFYSGVFLLDRMMFGIGSFALVKFLSEHNDVNEERSLISSSWIINLVIIGIISIVFYVSVILWNGRSQQPGLFLLLVIFPITAIIRLPFNQSLAIMQSKRDFFPIFVLRIVGMGLFFFFLLLNMRLHMSITYVAIAFVLACTINTAICIINNWSGVSFVRFTDVSRIRKLLKFGKYSMGTYLCTNILRESDIFIIGFMMTKVDAALFVIPLRLIDILNVPIMGLVAVFIPKISRANSIGDKEKVRRLLYQYAGFLTILFIPFIGVLYFIAPFLISSFGGSEYLHSNIAVTVFRIFLLYGLLLTVDVFAGVTLDSINRPKLNFVKVVIMVAINIIGDFIVVIYFNSLIAVAIVTVINSFCGLCIGIFLLNGEMRINLVQIFPEGYGLCKSRLTVIVNSIANRFA